MRILITGGRGFVGRHLVHELHRAGHEIVVSDIPRANKTIFSEEKISVISCDITNLREVHQQPDAIRNFPVMNPAGQEDLFFLL